MLSTRQRFTTPRGLSTSLLSSDVRNSWKCMAFLFGAQSMATTFANLHGGVTPCQATNTELLHHPSITRLLIMFLTFETGSFGVLWLPIYNTVLMTALLDWPRVWPNTSYKEVITHLSGVSGIIALRMILGYIFGRGTGFAYPVLFFNDAIHEKTCGLSMILLYCITRRIYSGPFPDHNRLSPLVFILLWLPNAMRGPTFFWAFSVASVAGIQALLSLLSEGRKPVLPSLQNHITDKMPSKWSRCMTMVRKFLLLAVSFVAISYLHHITYLFNHEAHSEAVGNLPESVLTEFLVLSYPRRNDSTLLSSTLQSYTPGIGSRFATSVYTTIDPTLHPAFGEAETTFGEKFGLRFFPDPNPALLSLSRLTVPGYLPGKQTFDLYSALSWAERSVRINYTRYIGIMEDDFEWCNDGWREFKAVLYEVALRELSEPSQGPFCGIFVATGGSGLLIRPSIIPKLQMSLQRYAFDLNPDIILQDCLRGVLPECDGCRLAASRRLLFRHTGGSKSTYRGRLYPEDRWQCGWRQPFNGKLGVWVP